MPLEGDLVEEPEGGDGLVVDAPGDVLLLDEVEEVGADVVAARGLRASVPKWRAKVRDARDVGLDGPGGEVPELHVLDHAAAQRCHDVLLC